MSQASLGWSKATVVLAPEAEDLTRDSVCICYFTISLRPLLCLFVFCLVETGSSMASNSSCSHISRCSASTFLALAFATMSSISSTFTILNSCLGIDLGHYLVQSPTSWRHLNSYYCIPDCTSLLGRELDPYNPYVHDPVSC